MKAWKLMILKTFKITGKYEQILFDNLEMTKSY